jgi:hypothetical protein
MLAICVARKLHDDILKATKQTSLALQAELNNLRSTATRRVQLVSGRRARPVPAGTDASHAACGAGRVGVDAADRDHREAGVLRSRLREHAAPNTMAPGKSRFPRPRPATPPSCVFRSHLNGGLLRSNAGLLRRMRSDRACPDHGEAFLRPIVKNSRAGQGSMG